MTVMSDTASDRSVHLRPLWPPPRSPLSPYRLAKLANALGVSTPLPATHNPRYSVHGPPSPLPSASLADSTIRSQTPSVVSMQHFSPHTTSRYLLHVIPPDHLPHTIDPDEFDLTPLPASASGYHSQYKRGTLVPLHSTLQSQLLAIAKEYALPSTAGIVLYLVSSTPGKEYANRTQNSDTSRIDWENEEPGPRLSDVVWKHIWMRVLRVERDDTLSFLSRTGTPDSPYLASLSSPSLLLDTTTPSHPLRPLISPQKLDSTTSPTVGYPITPSPSTPSFDLHIRGQSNSKPSGYRSVSTPVDPNASPSMSSASLDPNVDALELPGLNSPSLIPILAKVEFDIDRRKAAWYEPWLRSRRRNHTKRAISRTRGTSECDADLNEDEEKRPPINLRLLDRLQDEGTPEFLREREEGYSQLDEDEEEITAQFPAVPGGSDPLADIFGTDADTWANLHADQPPSGKYDLWNADLALDGSALSGGMPEDHEEQMSSHDESEVRGLWHENSRPRLSLSAGADHVTVASANSEVVNPQGDLGPMPSSEEESIGLGHLKITSSNVSSVPTGGSTLVLAGSDATSEKAGLEVEVKRGGAFFNDINLGLADSVDCDDEQYDENDPFDRRKSQYLLKAKLDEIEKALVQFSPRALRSGFPDPEDQPVRSPAPSRTSVSSSSTLLGAGGPSPSKSSLKTNGTSVKAEDAVWPAVPYSTLNASDSQSSSYTPYHETPTWTLNGVSSVPPRSPYTGKQSSNVISDETKARQEAENTLYPPLHSPLLPLSQDPFGRYPPDFDTDYGVPQEREHVPHPTSPTRKASLDKKDSPVPSSRFSADSAVSEDVDVSPQKSAQRGSSLVSVKSIRKLWRKSNKVSLSGAPPLPHNASGKSSPQPPLTPPAPVAKDPSVPPSSPSFNDTPPPPSLPSSRTPSRAGSFSDQIRFDQEPRYLIHPNATSPPTKSVAPLTLTSSNAHSRSPLPANRSLQSTDKGGSVRKSILKSWKSTTGSISQLPESVRSTPEPSTRKRRPSIFDPASSFLRGSVISTVSEQPPTPTIPDHYFNGPAPTTKTNRPSTKPRPAPAGSYSSTESSSPSVISPVSSSSPPQPNIAVVRKGSRESFGSRSSWDNSKFELPPPKPNEHGMRSSLTYPYHELDHQE